MQALEKPCESSDGGRVDLPGVTRVRSSQILQGKALRGNVKMMSGFNVRRREDVERFATKGLD